MFTEERQQQILEILQKKQSATVEELEQVLYVSASTVRRDLSYLEKIGLLRRTHGGALLVDKSGEEASSRIREQQNIREKRQIAAVAAELIANNSSLFLDSSSTTAQLVPLLGAHQGLTVITNGLKHAMLLSEEPGIQTIVTGGTVALHSNSITGSETLFFLSSTAVDCCIFSCSAIDAAFGISETSVEQAKIKQQMLKNAKRKILLCDSSKFDQIALRRCCTLAEIDDLVTGPEPPAVYRELAQQLNYRLHFAAP